MADQTWWAFTRPTPATRSGARRQLRILRNTRFGSGTNRGTAAESVREAVERDPDLALLEECVPVFQYSLGPSDSQGGTESAVKVVMWVRGYSSQNPRLKWRAGYSTNKDAPAIHGTGVAVRPGAPHRADKPYELREFMNGFPKRQADPRNYERMCQNILQRARREALKKFGYRSHRDRVRPPMLTYHPGNSTVVSGVPVPTYPQLNSSVAATVNPVARRWAELMEDTPAWKRATAACTSAMTSDAAAVRRLAGWVQHVAQSIGGAGPATKGYWRTVLLPPGTRLAFVEPPDE